MPQDLHQRLEEIINNTEPGDRLPSEPKLAGILGVSRATLREAMRTFETHGRIRRRQGVGTFVNHPGHVIESGLEVLESIEVLAERIGLPVSMGELKIDTIAANGSISDALDIPSGTSVLRISRVICAENHPVAYLVDIIPDHILSETEVENEFSGSVLDQLLKRGSPVLKSSYCEIAAVLAENEIPRALNLQRGTPLICLESILYTEDGSPVDYSFSYFLQGYFKFHVVRKVET